MSSGITSDPTTEHLVLALVDPAFDRHRGVGRDLSGIERVTLRGGDYQVGGLAGLRQWLNKKRPLLTMDLRDRGMRPPRGVLLVGVPGCGKSLSAKAIATSWELPLYRLDMASIFGQYVGQSENRLKEALATAAPERIEKVRQLGDRAIPASGRQLSLGAVRAQPRARRVVLS